MSYPKGDRDGLIKDCVHNHLLLSNLHSSQSGGKLCFVSTNTNSHKCASSGFGIEQENTERSVQQMLCHSSHCHLAQLLHLLLEPELDYVLGQFLLFCCPNKTPGLCPLLGKKWCRGTSAALPHQLPALGLHCHSPNLSSFMSTAKAATLAVPDQGPKVTCLQEILASLRDLKNNPRLHPLNSHG